MVCDFGLSVIVPDSQLRMWPSTSLLRTGNPVSDVTFPAIHRIAFTSRKP